MLLVIIPYFDANNKIPIAPIVRCHCCHGSVAQQCAGANLATVPSTTFCIRIVVENKLCKTASHRENTHTAWAHNIRPQLRTHHFGAAKLWSEDTRCATIICIFPSCSFDIVFCLIRNCTQLHRMPCGQCNRSISFSVICLSHQTQSNPIRYN